VGDRLVVSAPSQLPRNPGPNWGYLFLLWAERWWPRWLFRLSLKAGTWIGVAFMPAQRAHSRAYLSEVLGRPPKLHDIWRHFFFFAEFLVLKFQIGRGLAIRCAPEPDNWAAFEALLASGRPALFGTFHFGASDLLGYLLAGRGRRVSIIRLRVGNSDDTRLLGQRYSEQVSFLWVNDPGTLLFDLKAAIEAGESLALMCDRMEFTSKTEPFHFLGKRRLFPFTIYHLAQLFDRPVVFCTAFPAAPLNELTLVASPVFTPDPAAGRDANARAARAHFQSVLAQLETLVRKHPMLWFNFLPLNPEAPNTAR
jgi:predicted LPLAT superfamily acyltransferase